MSQNVNVNLTPGGYPKEFHVSQYDVGRQLVAKVVDSTGDYSIPSGATAVLVGTKPSGFGFTLSGSVGSGGVVTFSTTATVTAEYGRIPCEIRITNGSTILGTANCMLVVEESPHQEGVIDGNSETVIPELTILVERVEAAASNVLDMQVEADTLPAGSSATYSYNEETNTATFGIPQGEAGAGAAGVVASAYSASSTYAVGDYVIHDGNLYRCTTAITTAEAFTAAHWTQVLLGNDVSDLKSDITELTGLADNVAYYPHYTQGGYYDGTGNFVTDANWGYTPIFPVEANTRYYLNVPTAQYITYYDANKTVIPAYDGVTYFDTGENVKYVRLGIYSTRQSACVVTKGSLYKNYVAELQNVVDEQITEGKLLTQKILIKDFIIKGTSFQHCNTINIDRSYKTYFVMKNTSSSNSTTVKLYLTQAGSNGSTNSGDVTLAAGASHTWVVDAQLDKLYGEWENYFAASYIGFSGYENSNVEVSVTVIQEKDLYIDGLRERKNTVICNPNSDGHGVFKNIQNAIDYCKTHFDVQNESATVFLMDGTYELNYVSSRNAVINKGANRINIIGESRDGVKLVLTSTPAQNNKIIEHGGASTIKNASFYNYWNEDGSTISYANNSYCIHNDLSFTSDEEYETVVENCYLYSEAFAPIGAGLWKNQKQKYINVESVFNSLDERSGGYNQWAPIYVHSPSQANQTNCSVEIDGCTCIAKKGTMAIVLPNVPNMTPQYTDIPVSIRRTIGVTNGSTITNVSKSTHDLQTDSALNNVEAWNY